MSIPRSIRSPMLWLSTLAKPSICSGEYPVTATRARRMTGLNLGIEAPRLFRFEFRENWSNHFPVQVGIGNLHGDHFLFNEAREAFENFRNRSSRIAE